MGNAHSEAHKTKYSVWKIILQQTNPIQSFKKMVFTVWRVVIEKSFEKILQIWIITKEFL